MKWVTRKRVHVNRAATAWLIRRFLDPEAEIVFVEPAEVEGVQRREGAVGFDAPGALYPHCDERGHCSFEQLVDERLADDPALRELARIVHGADFPEQIDTTPESAGLWAISQGFTEVAKDDPEIVERASFLYDSLYAHLRKRLGAEGGRRPSGGSKMKRILALLALSLSLAAPTASSLSAQEGTDATWKKVDGVFGIAGKAIPGGVGGVHRFGWPRRDLHVQVGDVPVEPALALGSWAAFVKAGDDRAMAMGDLVLLEAELTPVIDALTAGGIEISAVHNHLNGETPHVVYVHFSGHGEAAALAQTLKAALAKTKTPLGPPAASAKPSAADEQAFKTVQEVLGKTGTMAGTVLQVGVPRAERIEEKGMEIPPAMGMSTALNFQRVGERVATTGDFVLVASEVNPVIHELRAHGIAVTALHSHMLEESPRLFFMHFWGVDTPEKIADGLKAALSKVHTK